MCINIYIYLYLYVYIYYIYKDLRRPPTVTPPMADPGRASACATPTQGREFVERR